MWKYEQKTGDVTNPSGALVGCGYSGNGDGLNNPSAEQEEGVGPIPVGQYTIGRFFDDPEKGPIVAHLSPCSNTNTWGRSGFMVHGDNPKLNHSASHGCIILSHVLREMLMASNDRLLEVTA
jgi:hypothetical protein